MGQLLHSATRLRDLHPMPGDGDPTWTGKGFDLVHPGRGTAQLWILWIWWVPWYPSWGARTWYLSESDEHLHQPFSRGFIKKHILGAAGAATFHDKMGYHLPL